LEVTQIKTLIQCDFDGTISVEDVSFIILDQFATQPWRPYWEQYTQGKITVGQFNTRAFSLVKADRQTMLDYVKKAARIRPGLPELVEFCRKKTIDFVIISNGLDFYINFILKSIGLNGIQVIAAKTTFDPNGLKVQYPAPDGKDLMEKFKETYTRLYLNQGYQVIYIGNGVSDFPSARLSYRVFATQDLMTCCKNGNLKCIPFENMHDIITGLRDIE
jgi:2-hydroxy-3-keto-5-methylthiopentenyl-1-phosphate phosphatase